VARIEGEDLAVGVERRHAVAVVLEPLRAGEGAGDGDAVAQALGAGLERGERVDLGGGGVEVDAGLLELPREHVALGLVEHGLGRGAVGDRGAGPAGRRDDRARRVTRTREVDGRDHTADQERRDGADHEAPVAARGRHGGRLERDDRAVRLERGRGREV
jgi:hypothetical protein